MDHVWVDLNRTVGAEFYAAQVLQFADANGPKAPKPYTKQVDSGKRTFISEKPIMNAVKVTPTQRDANQQQCERCGRLRWVARWQPRSNGRGQPTTLVVFEQPEACDGDES